MIFLCKPNRVRRTYLGGHRIDRLRGIEAEDGFRPEEWIASVTAARNAGSNDPLEGLSITSDGRILADILKENPSYLGGLEKLPILLKLLDASERLVVQVHPTVAFAKEAFHSDFGKTECWYVISADKDAHVYLGFKEGVTREAWEDCYRRQDSETMLNMLHKLELTPGDVWFVAGGVPHAIGGGCLLAELQEPTDLMVVPEMYTPSGRRIADERMHGGLGFDRMFDCFTYTGYSLDELKQRFLRHPVRQENKRVPIIDGSLTDKFSLDEYTVKGKTEVSVKRPSAAVVIEGNGMLNDTAVRAGDCLFITADTELAVTADSMRVLIAY